MVTDRFRPSQFISLLFFLRMSGNGPENGVFLWSQSHSSQVDDYLIRLGADTQRFTTTEVPKIFTHLSGHYFSIMISRTLPLSSTLTLLSTSVSILARSHRNHRFSQVFHCCGCNFLCIHVAFALAYPSEDELSADMPQ
jgi:hypothetical protein